MEKIKRGLYIASLSATALSIFFTLLSNPWQRYGFYYAFYFALTGLVAERRKLHIPRFDLSYAVILMGLVKIISTLILYRHDSGFGMGMVQLDTGKKMVLGGLTLFYLSQFTHYLQPLMTKKLLITVVACAFLAATAYGFWQINQGAKRIDLSSNRATIAAYLYSMLALLYIWLLMVSQPVRRQRLLIPLVIIVSFVVVILTGTRAAILAHLPLLAAMMLFYHRKIRLKPLVIVTLLVVLGATACWKSHIEPKINQTIAELSNYQRGNDRTSLGSRFSLWIVGIEIFKQHPLGITREARYLAAEELVKGQPQNRAALRFINSHLHNEMIEAGSLQGIFGLLALLTFYVSLFISAVVRHNTALFVIGCCAVVYGLTDVMMISQESLMFLLACIAVFFPYTDPPRQSQVSGSLR